MKLFREKSVVISTISAIDFAIYYLCVLFDKTTPGVVFPVWFSIIGAALMCWLPIMIVQSDGSRKIAMLGGSFALLVSIALLLTLHEGK